MIRAFKTILALFSLHLIAACGMQENLEEAKSEINDFHYNYDADEWEDIWARTGSEFKKQQSQKAFSEMMQSVKAALGEELESNRTGMRMSAATPVGAMTVVTMQTRFEKGEGTETFTFRTDDGVLTLIGYNINSPAMMEQIMRDAAKGRAAGVSEN